MDLGEKSLLDDIEYRASKNLFLTHTEIDDRVKQIVVGLYFLKH